MINYIEQINGFWKKCEQYPNDLSATEIAIYFALLYCCNRTRWVNPFKCHYHEVNQVARVAKNTYYRNMDKLHDKGFIVFTKGEKNKSSPFVSIIKLENKSVTKAIQNEEQNEELADEQGETFNKQINKKNEKKYKNNINDASNNLNNNNNLLLLQSNSKFINEFKEEILSNTEIRDNITLKFNLDENIAKDLLFKFYLEQAFGKTQYRNIDEVVRHLNNWTGKKYDKKFTVNPENPSEKMLGKD